LSEALGMSPSGLAARHVRLLKSLGLDPGGPLPPTDRIVDAMRMDKKYATGIRFVLLENVGKPRVVRDVPDETIVATLKELGAEG
jgi:3-dehydroquinate synthetase